IGSGVLDFSAAPDYVDDEDVVDVEDDASMRGEVSSADSEPIPDADRQDAVRGGGKSAARAAPFS
ncbi:MAG: hypothetical protein IJK99_05925, partial [Bacteroidales bacterium]|nr:hypothetical protein [Bacteroidales bacterium]